MWAGGSRSMSTKERRDSCKTWGGFKGRKDRPAPRPDNREDDMMYLLASSCGFLVGFALAAMLAAAGRSSAYNEGFEDGYEHLRDASQLHDWGPGATG